MTDDIVTQIREHPYKKAKPKTWQLLYKAVDEIERLRAEIERLRLERDKLQLYYDHFVFDKMFPVNENYTEFLHPEANNGK